MENKLYDMECCKCRDNFRDIHIWASCNVCGGRLKVIMERSTG